MAKFKWTIEIEVDETWVADGFDATDERMHSMLAHHLPYAYGHELKAKVLARPADEAVAKAQGFRNVAEYLHVRRSK
jgi:hypothetical protein